MTDHNDAAHEEPAVSANGKVAVEPEKHRTEIIVAIIGGIVVVSVALIMAFGGRGSASGPLPPLQQSRSEEQNIEQLDGLWELSASEDGTWKLKWIFTVAVHDGDATCHVISEARDISPEHHVTRVSHVSFDGRFWMIDFLFSNNVVGHFRFNGDSSHLFHGVLNTENKGHMTEYRLLKSSK